MSHRDKFAMQRHVNQIIQRFGTTDEEAVRAANLATQLQNVAHQFFDDNYTVAAEQIYDDLRLAEAFVTANAVKSQITQFDEEERGLLSRRLTDIIRAHDVRNDYEELDVGGPENYSLNPAVSLKPNQLLTPFIAQDEDFLSDDPLYGRVNLHRHYRARFQEGVGDKTKEEVDNLLVALPGIDYAGPIRDVPGRHIARETDMLSDAWKRPSGHEESAVLDQTRTKAPVDELVEMYKEKLVETGTPQPETSRYTVQDRFVDLLANKKGSETLIDRPDSGEVIDRQIAVRELRSELYLGNTVDILRGYRAALEELAWDEERALDLQKRGLERADEMIYKVQERTRALVNNTQYLSEELHGETVENVIVPGPGDNPMLTD